MIDEELRTLSPDTYERAVALATLPDVVRGYEEIKLRNVERYRAEIARLAGSADMPVRVLGLDFLRLWRSAPAAGSRSG